jgi:Lon protease-like protein
MPLALRVFEERYLKMMGAILDEEIPQFGVVLIERGPEVGGGEQRFDVGTLAELLEVAAPDGPLTVLARGTRRFRVTSWADDDPYPMAHIELLEELERGSDDESLIARTEEAVRDTLRYVEGLTDELPWSSDIELSDDTEERVWQLAGISPLGPLDQQDFLSADSVASLATSIHATVTDALEVFTLRHETPDED